MSAGRERDILLAGEWKELSPAERATRARRLAEEAKSMAAQSSADARDDYEKLAREWLRLAVEIERAANIPSPPAPRGSARRNKLGGTN